MPQVRINPGRIKKVAELLKNEKVGDPLNFYSVRGKDGAEIVFSDMYPPLHAPYVHDFFWFAVMHQFGFWRDDGEKYTQPLYGTLNEKKLKGSDLLWRLIFRACAKNPERFTPVGLRTMARDEFLVMFSDDDGPVSLLATEERYQLTLEYGGWFLLGDHTPDKLIAIAQVAKDPAATMLRMLQSVPGYGEDPLAKKALLLLMVETNRPEHFINPEAGFVWPPVIDYHLMRIALRLGLITLSPEWRKQNTQRLFISGDHERKIRHAVYDAITLLIRFSGRTMSEIDALLWLLGRKSCLEMEEPRCSSCVLEKVCVKRTTLFQPVYRTTAY